MHPTYAAGNGTASIEIVSRSTPHHHRKREVLTLRIGHPLGSLSINTPEAEAIFKVGRNSPVGPDKIAPNTHIVRPVVRFRSPRNYSERPAKRKIPIAA